MQTKQTSIEAAVNGLRFRGLEDINCVKLLKYTSEFDRILGQSNKQLIAVARLLARCFISPRKIDYRKNGNDNRLCLAFLTAMERPDIRSIRQSLLTLGVPFDTLTEIPAVSLNWTSWPGLILHLISWTVALKKTRLQLHQKIVVLQTILNVFSLKQYVAANIKISQYALLTVFYDADPLHNALVQLFQNNGVKTATLQHGIILAPRAGATDNIDFAGIELTGSISDYFLAWNNFTKREAIRAGIPPGKIQVLGITRCFHIPQSPQPHDQKLNSQFGVLLDGRFTQANNAKILTIANELGTKLNLKYRLRYHPNFTMHEYDSIVDWDVCAGVSPREEPLMSFANQVEFTILGNSTALIELAYRRHPTQVYATGTVYDKFFDAAIQSFKTTEQLETLLKKQTGNTGIFDDLCTVQDISKAYTSFFKSFIETP